MSVGGEDEARDRELENLLGQFLVASFQGERLAEMIYDKLAYRETKEMKLVLPAGGRVKRPLAVTIRIEPSAESPTKKPAEEEAVGAIKGICLVETPGLDLSAGKLRRAMEEVLGGSFRWWMSQDEVSHLRLDSWKLNVAVIDSKDSKKLAATYSLLGNLEAKRKGETIER